MCMKMLFTGTSVKSLPSGLYSSISERLIGSLINPQHSTVLRVMHNRTSIKAIQMGRVPSGARLLAGPSSCAHKYMPLSMMHISYHHQAIYYGSTHSSGESDGAGQRPRFPERRQPTVLAIVCSPRSLSYNVYSPVMWYISQASRAPPHGRRSQLGRRRQATPSVISRGCFRCMQAMCFISCLHCSNYKGLERSNCLRILGSLLITKYICMHLHNGKNYPGQLLGSYERGCDRH